MPQKDWGEQREVWKEYEGKVRKKLETARKYWWDQYASPHDYISFRWQAPDKNGPSDSHVIWGTAGIISDRHLIHSSSRDCEVVPVCWKRGSEMTNKSIACEPEIIDLTGSSTEFRFHEVTLTFPLLTCWSQSFCLWLNEKSLSRSDQISRKFFQLD